MNNRFWLWFIVFMVFYTVYLGWKTPTNFRWELSMKYPRGITVCDYKTATAYMAVADVEYNNITGAASYTGKTKLIEFAKDGSYLWLCPHHPIR